MTPGRPVLPVALVALLLLGAAAYLGVEVLGAGTDAVGLAYPGRPDELIEPPAAPAVLGAEGAETVVLELRPRARLLAPWQPPAVVWSGRGDGEGPAVRWIAGSAAIPGWAGGPRGPQLLRVELPGGAQYRAVHLAAGQDSVELDLGAPRSYGGRVVDDAGSPVGGAAVWLAGRTAVTGDDGRFTIDGLCGRSGFPLVLRAAGKADLFRVVDLAGPEPTFVLELGTSLHVRYAGARPGGDAVQVLVMPPASGSGESGLLHYPFFWPAVAGGWPLAGDGSCRITGLPRGVRIALAVRHSSLIATEPTTVELGDREQTVYVRGQRTASLTAVVVDRTGVPLAGAVALGGRPPATARGPRYLVAPAAVLAGVGYAVSANDGRLALPRRGGDQPFTVRAAGRPGLAMAVHGGALADQRIALPDPLPAGDLAAAPALRLLPARPLRLVVARGGSRDPGILLPAGRPFALRLREPVVVDVTVHAGGAERRLADLAVWSAVDLPLP